MTLEQWLFSSYNNPSINGQWGLLHIGVLLLCVTTIVCLTLFFKDKSREARKTVINVLVALILIFELSRRLINIAKLPANAKGSDWLYILLPRPWCAMACWTLIISVFVDKKWFYNFASMTALLCALIFFAYPGVGFNNVYMEFENIYSIGTHSLLLITSITMITLRITKFKYKTFWKTAICYAVVLAYTFLQIYVLKTEADPMYFMPGNDVQDIFGVGYGAYLIIYIVFSAIYFNLFYLIPMLIKKVKARRVNNKQIEKTQC